MRAIIAILVLGFLWVSPAFARTPGNVLPGAKTLHVVIDLSATSKDRCSIKREDIVSAYKFPFSNSNIVLSDTIVGSDLILYIIIGSTDIRQGKRLIGCAFNIDFIVKTFMLGALPFNGKRWGFFAELFDNSSIHNSSASGFRNYIRGIIEEKSKNFITAYNLDNK